MALSAQDVRSYRKWQAYEQLFAPSRPKVVFDQAKWQLHDFAGDHIGRDTPITYLEFGVANGGSLRRTTARFTHPDSRFFGFDSFHGLPEDWWVATERNIARGTFSSDGQTPDIRDPRVAFVTGWFQNTVLDFLRSHRSAFEDKVVLIHYDADLYSSTLFCLTTIWSHISQYYFIMDDFAQDDCIALHDFSKAFPVRVEWFAHSRNPANDWPDQPFGLITRIPLHIDTTVTSSAPAPVTGAD